MMLHTKYQGSGPFRYRQEDFLRFSYTTLYKTGKSPFYPRGII